MQYKSMRPVTAPVVMLGSLRESPPNDYLRVIFISGADQQIKCISRCDAIRAFVTATPLYTSGPLTLQEFPNYSGLMNQEDKVLVAMRCRPPHPEKVDALLATWPNVFRAVLRDVPYDSQQCVEPSADAATQAVCYAKAYSDPPMTSASKSLAHTFEYAGKIYEHDSGLVADWLQAKYGIYRAFSGTGYAVKDSYCPERDPMTAHNTLEKSVSTEFILKNVSLSEAGCRCIVVPSYSGRSKDPLDPNFISDEGGDGTCTVVKKLRRSGR